MRARRLLVLASQGKEPRMAKASELIGRHVVASDGEVGTVEDLYFDDERWTVRYLVARTGGWLDARLVLLSPASVESTDGDVRVGLTRERIERAPDIDTDKPVSRRLEQAHASYYGYPYYWRGPHLWGTGIYPGVVPMPAVPPEQAQELERRVDEEREAAEHSHLRSVREVVDYSVQAADGEAGTVDDLEFDPKSWAVTGIEIDTKPWWPGGNVRVAPDHVQAIDWDDRTLRTDENRDALKARAS
jgi:sporulation protein YlmC with PRC-barrel domain